MVLVRATPPRQFLAAWSNLAWKSGLSKLTTNFAVRGPEVWATSDPTASANGTRLSAKISFRGSAIHF